jgi:hypothetical protein
MRGEGRKVRRRGRKGEDKKELRKEGEREEGGGEEKMEKKEGELF